MENFWKQSLLLAIWFFIAQFAICQSVQVGIAAPSDAFKVTVVQPIRFGAFSQGATGGSITVKFDGSRFGEGSVIPLNFGADFSPLLLEIEAPAGTIVSLLSSSCTLRGSNGGSIQLTLENSFPASPFNITNDPPAKTTVQVAGKLTVGNMLESPQGDYSGEIILSFMFE